MMRAIGYRRLQWPVASRPFGLCWKPIIMLRTVLRLFLVVCIFSTITGQAIAADAIPWIVIGDDGKRFVEEGTGKSFTPWGFNYDHEGDGKLLEEYWETRWDAVESAFAEMESLGANVVRIHLQFGAFMQSPTEAKPATLAKLRQLLKLAEQHKLYLNLTGLACYHKDNIPDWYDALTEPQRWRAQAVFWEAVSKECAGTPIVFCYDLMNEPVVPGGDKPRADWLGPGFGDKFFVQFISLDRQGRERTAIARRWIKTLVSAIRKHDQRRLITVGLVPWSLDRPGLTSGFAPDKIADQLDFISVHLYPKTGEVDEAVETLKGFAAAGKPVVIEEVFPLKCGVEDLERFLIASREHACGWIGFYWGKTPKELKPPKTIGEALTLGWLELFQRKRELMLGRNESKRED